jgi:hypothetical protein
MTGRGGTPSPYLSPLLLHASFAGLSPQRAHELIATELAARSQRHDDAPQDAQ